MDFVDRHEVESENIEEISLGNTVGLLHADRPVWINGDVRIHIPRLRRALLAFEDEFDAETVEMGIAENPENDDSFPILLMTPPDGSSRAIAVAPRYSGENKTAESDADEVITEGSA